LPPPRAAATSEPAIPQLPALPQLSAAERYKTEIVCKTTRVTGLTFVRRKSCLTRKQWDYVADEQQAAARKLVEDNGRNARSF
jgi:hypothetical protein